jgi:hypothetical protein
MAARLRAQALQVAIKSIMARDSGDRDREVRLFNEWKTFMRAALTAPYSIQG